MYTVIRFLSRSVTQDKVLAIGQAMNEVRAGVFTGLRPRDDGFACDVCDDPLWAVQARALGDFITEFDTCIRRAVSAGMSVTIDIMIEPEDRELAAVKIVVFHPELLSALGLAGIRLEVSIYQ